MLSDECGHSGDSKSVTSGADYYSRRADNVLHRRISGTDLECSKLISVVNRSYDAGNNGESDRQLHGDGDERLGMHGSQCGNSCDSNSAACSHNYGRRSDDVLRRWQCDADG
jgi:hypothetical protein